MNTKYEYFLTLLIRSDENFERILIYILKNRPKHFLLRANKRYFGIYLFPSVSHWDGEKYFPFLIVVASNMNIRNKEGLL